MNARRPSPALASAHSKASPLRTATAQIWLADSGVVHLEPIAQRQQELSDAVENVNGVAQVACGVRRPLLIHFQRAVAQSPECRAHYTSDEAARRICACGIVTSSVLGRVIGNLMIGMSKTRLPLKLFHTAENAEKWLLELWKLEQPSRIA